MLIGQFRVSLYLRFKTSPQVAKPFMRKRLLTFNPEFRSLSPFISFRLGFRYLDLRLNFKLKRDRYT